MSEIYFAGGDFMFILGFLLDACLYHSVLARPVTGTCHVAFKYKWGFNFVEFLEQPLVLE